MPKELRKIIFHPNELIGALYSYCLHAGKPMPRTQVSELVLGSTPEEMASLRFDAGTSGKERQVTLTREEVAAALIRYCRQIGVPIPKGAQKVLQPDGDDLALMIHYEFDPTTPRKD